MQQSAILGIHDGHNCGATLTVNGRVIASVCEERLTRQKNESGYPQHAIDDVLRIGGIDRRDLDEVVYSSLFMHSKAHLENIDPWYRVGLSEQRASSITPEEYRKIVFEERRRQRIDAVREHLGTNPGQVEFLEHHLCHVAAALFTSPTLDPERPILGLTCDGAGDNLSATVSVFRDGKIDRVAATNRHASLGKIYSRVTRLLGMKPWEHEYKIMGLAPYAESEPVGELTRHLHQLIRVSNDGLGFEQVGELSTNYCYEYLRDVFEATRFDLISGAVQRFTEELLTEWIRRAIGATGISDIVCGGGVFMNVKANMLVANLPEVSTMYVMPSAGDESLSIGACLLRHHANGTLDSTTGGVFDNLYLGGDFCRDDEKKAVADSLAGGSGYTIEELPPADIDLKAADLLADGNIVARCRGRMEWGARALGNRSILANPADFRIVDRINRAIKHRDFWMPFAPSILDSAAERYFENPKDIRAWYMTHAFRTLHATRSELEAASHPRDGTIRPQLVTRSAAPGYHRLIARYEERTGCGGVLNTSFNLHGYPIVYSPADALHVLAHSDLNHLVLNNFIVSKRP